MILAWKNLQSDLPNVAHIIQAGLDKLEGYEEHLDLVPANIFATRMCLLFLIYGLLGNALTHFKSPSSTVQASIFPKKNARQSLRDQKDVSQQSMYKFSINWSTPLVCWYRLHSFALILTGKPLHHDLLKLMILPGRVNFLDLIPQSRLRGVAHLRRKLTLISLTHHLQGVLFNSGRQDIFWAYFFLK